MLKLEMYYDYTCPFCLRGYGYLQELMPQYPQIEVEWHPCEAHPRPEHYGRHSDLCARGMYFALDHGVDLMEYHNRMYNAASIQRVDIEDLQEVAKVVEGLLDSAAFHTALNEGAYLDRLLANNQLAWESYGFQAVPSFRMNGRQLNAKEGVGVSLEQLEAFIKQNISRKKIYLAGGCFWGVEKYISLIPGVISTEAGYANGKTENPTYDEVCRKNTGHAETVQVEYDPNQVSLTFLLELFFKVIDPTSLNRQGGDVGEQYRTGVYYTDIGDEEIVRGMVVLLGESLDKPVMIEVKPLLNYYPAEIYHQKYLDKNPGGYCHIQPDKFEKVRAAIDEKTRYRHQSKQELRSKLTDLQFEVTQNGATEPPFQNAYANMFKPGIYVDITSGEPLFVSTDKFESGCGWPSFSRPISADLIAEFTDHSYGRSRIEVRSSGSDAHLGHVFADGPKELGGMRYCINSAALRFVPRESMEAEGYGHLLGLLVDPAGR